MKNTEKTLDQIKALCIHRGFVYPGSEIYGGLANTWDYGPLGVELKENIKKAWRKKIRSGEQVQRRLGFRDTDEPADLGSVGARGRILRSAYGLQGLQNASPRR